MVATAFVAVGVATGIPVELFCQVSGAIKIPAPPRRLAKQGVYLQVLGETNLQPLDEPRLTRLLLAALHKMA